MTDPRDTDAALLAQSGRRAEAIALARPRKRELDPIQQVMGCPTPVWENLESSKLADGGCSVFGSTGRCRDKGTHHVWIGCTTGEHLDKSDACSGHAAQMSAYQGVFYCRRCWDALNVISKARVIKIELMDDEGTTPAPAPHARLVP